MNQARRELFAAVALHGLLVAGEGAKCSEELLTLRAARLAKFLDQEFAATWERGPNSANKEGTKDGGQTR